MGSSEGSASHLLRRRSALGCQNTGIDGRAAWFCCIVSSSRPDFFLGFQPLHTDAAGSPSIRSYRSRLKDWGYRRQDEKHSSLSNESTQRRATCPTAETITVSDNTSDEDDVPTGAKTTSRSELERLSPKAHELPAGIPRVLSPGASGHISLLSGPSVEPVQGHFPSGEFIIPPIPHLSPVRVHCPCQPIVTSCGVKCLHDATHEGFVHAVELLLQAGALATVQDEWGNTPLHIAINHLPYSPKTVSLLALQTSVNLKNTTGLTPFHRLLDRADVVQGLYISTVDKFLTLGADPQLNFPDGRTLLWAYLFNCTYHPLTDSVLHVIKKLLKEFPIESTCWNGH